MTSAESRPYGSTFWRRSFALFAVIFGAMTLISGGSVLFGPVEAQVAAGDYMPVVLWFNFLAGFLYIGAAIGIWLQRNWALGLSAFIAVATGLVALGFGFQVSQGVAYGMRTVGALALRIGVWIVITLTLMRSRHQM
ncbi:hypothetical protein [Pseudovibrio sp. Tun.PSC04-5.I4]|uniref:hypothetical protein n=1 Tax=Pseudovibrio sp. Tun.PSC04-5.I4 TaxID=1798213 RepID=UPI00088EEBB6|nr:hypothetical protein [Pseudovibrio sp. Tun.PSC04-5.I4]SDQ14386.1 hypothetical protein SAMN04515695_0153 [Pseudovibrio sp. Tun.PSC04-5.I4]